MDLKTIIYAVLLILSCIGLYFSSAYSIRKLKSGKIDAYGRIGANRLHERTHSRAHDPMNYWFFFLLYSTLLNGPPAALLIRSIQGILIRTHL